MKLQGSIDMFTLNITEMLSAPATASTTSTAPPPYLANLSQENNCFISNCTTRCHALTVNKSEHLRAFPALANLLWLGCEHPLCQKALLGARMLSCLSRLVWRKLILGKNDKDKLEKGIGGNCILLEQSALKCCAETLENLAATLQKATGTVYVPMEELFMWLQDREELEYSLPSDSAPYKARATSRFDTTEFTAIFGCVLRHMLILRSVGAVFSRKGYETDLKQIAKANTEDCIEALCGNSRKPGRHAAKRRSVEKLACERCLDQLAYVPDRLA